VPCNPGDLCPDGQAGGAGKCVIAGSVDGDSTPGGRDSDGIPDSADNCPDVANADRRPRPHRAV
jgi:hypothetical protein